MGGTGRTAYRFHICSLSPTPTGICVSLRPSRLTLATYVELTDIEERHALLQPKGNSTRHRLSHHIKYPSPEVFQGTSEPILVGTAGVARARAPQTSKYFPAEV